MRQDQRHSLSRRTLLALGSGAVVTLAGCSGDDGETEDTSEDGNGGVQEPTPTETTPTSTPTETTPTDTPTESNNGEPQELTTIFNNVSDGSELGDDTVKAEVTPGEYTDRFVFGVGPSEGFEDVNQALENGEAYIAQKTDQVPENGKVQFTFPWMNFLEYDREQLMEQSDQENPWVWKEVGGEQTLAALAETTNEEYENGTETVPVQIKHPRDTLNPETHNQRTQHMWDQLPYGEDYGDRTVYDLELLRQIAGPTIDQSLRQEFEEEWMPSLEESDVRAKAEFDYFDDESNYSSANIFLLKGEISVLESIGEDFEHHRTYSREDSGEIDIFRFTSEEFPDYVAEAAYHEDSSVLVWTTDAGDENIDTPLTTKIALDTLEGLRDSVSDEEDFMHSQEYESRILPVIGYHNSPRELSKNTDGYGNLVMLEWDEESETPIEKVVSAEDFELVNEPLERDDSGYLWQEF